MSTEIDGQAFFSANEVAEKMCVTRQTLWRWRKRGLIPLGHKHRDGRVLFSEHEVDSIEEYAKKMEPIGPSLRSMPTLF